MRRLAPRPLSKALDAVLADVEPATPLARAQALWPDVAGAELAAFATPVAERRAVLTLACESAVWAQELELVGPDLLARLNDAVAAAAGAEAGPGPAFARLRFVVGSGRA